MIPSTGEERVWLYLDQHQAQRGPFPTSVLLRLLEKGIGGITPQTMIWKQGFAQWQMIATVSEFQASCVFHATQWYYVPADSSSNGANSGTKGPVPTRFILHKMKEGEITLSTLVYRQESEGWKKVEDIAELREEWHKVEAEKTSQAAVAMSAEISNQEQVFNPEDVFETLPVLEAAEKTTEDRNDKAEDGEKGKKTFVADNGVKYKWDDEEDCWVMDESDDEEEGGNKSEDDEDSHSKDGEGEGGKRKREVDSEDDKEDEDKNPDSAATQSKPKKRRNKKKKKLPNTWVYVTGLPSNVTFDEIKDHFSKVGLIAISPYDQQPKIKIYKEDANPDLCKGDCSLCYNAEESVQLALNILDGGYIRPNYQITVTRATFEYNQTNTSTNATSSDNTQQKQRRPALSQAQIKVARNASRQALAWNVDEDIGVSKSSALRIVVLEGMFHPKNFQDPSFEKELEDDIAMECGKLGEIEKMTIFSRNPTGVVVLKFASASSAQECIRIMNGRYFGKAKIKCYYWDGVKNYSMVPNQDDEEEKEEEQRLQALGDWLENQDDLPEEFMLRTE